MGLVMISIMLILSVLTYSIYVDGYINVERSITPFRGVWVELKQKIIICDIWWLIEINFWSFPWNQNSIHGWLITAAVFTLCNTLCGLVHYNVVLFFIGIGDNLHSFSEHFAVEIKGLNASIQNQSENDNEIKEKLKNMIQFHVKIKE